MHHTSPFSGFRLLGLAAAFLICLNAGFSQSLFDDAVKQLSSDNVKGYLQPMVNSIGANMNSGTFRSAAIGSGSIHVDLRFIGMGTLIGDGEKMYAATPPTGAFDPAPVQTATVFGGEGTVIYDDPADPSVSYHFQNGQISTSLMPFAVPQLTVGDVMGTRAFVRYVPFPEMDNVPKITLFGVGVQHSISRYFPDLPVDIAAGVAYQTFKIGDLMEAKAFNINAMASKAFSVVTVYGGFQYETSSVTVTYTYTGIPLEGQPANSSLSVDMTGENKFRGTVGFDLDLVILDLNADISVGKVTTASAGLGFGF
jgi:hypothetical protein